jgi:hypothetical protein
MDSQDAEKQLKIEGNHQKNAQQWEIPLRLESYANKSGNWKANIIRKKKHNSQIDWHFLAQPLKIFPPCKLTLCRLAPRKLDLDDNLRFAFKNILDRLGQKLMPHKKVGHADGTGLIQVHYDQKKGQPREYKIIITIEEL